MDGPAFALTLILSTALDALAAGAILFAGFSFWRITFLRCLAALFVLLMVFLGKTPFIAGLGLDLFGAIYLAYLDLVVAVPLLSALVLLSTLRRRVARRPEITPLAFLAACAGLSLAGVGVDATWIEPFRLKLERADVPLRNVPADWGELRIGVLSDLQTAHVTAYERDAIARLMAERPDLILIPGDFFQASDAALERELPALRELVAALSAPGGIFAVLGNTDTTEHVRRIFEGFPVRFLLEADDAVESRVHDRTVRIEAGSPRRERPPALPGTPRIFLSHYPDAVLSLPADSSVDLVVAGHTHGGQVCLPWFGPLMTLSRVPRAVAAGGLHEVNGHRIYVSRGVGCERGQAPRVRFLCPPEITMLRLVPASDGGR